MKNTHRKPGSLVQLVALALGLVVAVPTALAADIKVISGWECRDVWWSTVSGSATDYAAASFGGATPKVPVASILANTHHYVVCPLVRDNIESSNKTGLKSLEIRAWRTSSGALDCTPYTVKTNGETVLPTASVDRLRKSLSLDTTRIQSLKWTATELGSADVDAFYFVRCLVGLGAGVVSVKYEE